MMQRRHGSTFAKGRPGPGMRSWILCIERVCVETRPGVYARDIRYDHAICSTSHGYVQKWLCPNMDMSKSGPLLESRQPGSTNAVYSLHLFQPYVLRLRHCPLLP